MLLYNDSSLKYYKTMEFKYAPMFQLGEDKTEYYKIPGSEKLVSTAEFEGKKILKVTPEALTLMTNTAFRDVSFLLRRSHNEQVAKILSDPEASANDKYVALTFLRNAEVASKGKLPLCQDTGTAIVHGEKGQQVWTGFEDEEAISLGVYKTYTEENLRYSQNAPLDMYNEVNTKCNLPAQIDIEATHGDEYRFLMVTKGGGSANKTYLYQETKARIQNPGTLIPFLVSKMRSLGTAACPPYHIAFVIGGTSAEKNLLTVKLASTHYYDSLPTTGDETGRAFRDTALEAQLLEAIEIDYIDESEVLSPADDVYHIDKTRFKVPFVCGAKDLGEALRRISEGASMIRTKGEPGTGDVVQAVRHMRMMNSEINKIKAMREDELFEEAKVLRVPYDLVVYVHDNGRLPVVNFAAGGVATPADAALMMQLGAEGVFVGSGIFKSGNPEKRANAIVKAVTNYTDASLIASLSEDLGEAMVGINEQEIELLMAERGK